MFFRRQKRSTRRSPRSGQFVELLEPRRLLTTINHPGGLFPPSTLEYKDASNNTVRVSYFNVDAELVWVRVAGTQPVHSLRVSPFSDDDGHDLFHVHVARSGTGSFISIAHVDDPDPEDPTKDRPMKPFDGNVSLRVFSHRERQIVDVSAGPGEVYLGARTNAENDEDRPIASVRFTGQGLLAARSNNRLVAGFTVAEGNDFGRFLFGGVVSGQVNVQGSMDSFYAGSLLTGTTSGQILGRPLDPNNFYVGGDLRDLLVGGSIGTHADGGGVDGPIYVTQPNIRVVGRLGQMKAGNSIIAVTQVDNRPDAPQFRAIQLELEDLVEFTGSNTGFQFGRFNGRESSFFRNDATNIPAEGAPAAQFLGVFDSRRLGPDVIAVEGILDYQNGDVNDAYAIGLRAGQTITVRLINFQGLGIYDPDNRLVATDFDNSLPFEAPFQFTAQQPGIYKFVIGRTGNNGLFTSTLSGSIVYQLQVHDLGNVGIGGIVAGNQIFNATNTPALETNSILLVDGDLGAIFSGGILYNAGPISTRIAQRADIRVHRGNLNAVDAAQIGLAQTANSFGTNFLVRGGHTGLIRARTGQANVESLLVFQLNGDGIGGDAQRVAAESGSLFVNIQADRRIGTIVAQNMATPSRSWIQANADGLNNDGLIDLIDVRGNFGTIAAGGPAISTGFGGNVRYIRVRGTVFRDRFFGGGEPEGTILAPGQRIDLTDDSGTHIRIIPAPNTNVNPFTGLSVIDPVTGLDDTNAGILTVTTYPIRGSGGVVVVKVQHRRAVPSNSVVEADGGIVEIRTTSLAAGGTAEIGRIELEGDGAPVISDPFPNDPDNPELVLDPTSTLNTSINIRGTAVTDVLDIAGGNFNTIRNRTGGEIVSIHAQSIGLLESRTLGLAQRSTPAALRFAELPRPIGLARTEEHGNADLDIVDGVATAFPFRDQRSGIVVTGPIVEARSYDGLGNFMVDGHIQRLYANTDGRFTRGQFDGINAPVFARGELRDVIIGEGILPSGSGDLSQAGLYALQRIRSVRNQGLGSDIRGDIVSGAGIGHISLKAGSIIGSRMMLLATPGTDADPTEEDADDDDDTSTGSGNDLRGARKFHGAIRIPQGSDQFGRLGQLERITISGIGGIMGAVFRTADLGRIHVGGFGIFSSDASTLGDGSFEHVVTDGYGIRDSSFRGGAFADGFHAVANGRLLHTTAFTPTVRFAEKMRFDPFTGLLLNPLNDLHMALETSAKRTRNPETSHSGAIEDSTFVASRNLGTMEAHSIKEVTISFGNEVNRISAVTNIEELELTAGRLNNFFAGRDVLRSDMTIAGPVINFTVGGTYRGTSALRAVGPNGRIENVIVNRSLFGTIESSVRIGSIRVGNAVGSPLISTGGNFDRLVTNGSILSGATVRSSKTLINLIVGGDVEAGALIQARELLNKTVLGDDEGTYLIG